MDYHKSREDQRKEDYEQNPSANTGFSVISSTEGSGIIVPRLTGSSTQINIAFDT